MPKFTSETLLEFLKQHEIPYELLEHPPVYTCDEALEHLSHIDALGTKNLFLREEKGSRVFLITVPDAKRVALGKLRYELGSSRLTFGSAELLFSLLGVEPGSVTMFGLANDIEQRVELFIDESVLTAARIQAHPLRNTASLLITPSAMSDFFRIIGRSFKQIPVPE